ncbi:amino acid ABC transporter ATP-binding/permease protein [soil metagenome]
MSHALQSLIASQRWEQGRLLRRAALYAAIVAAASVTLLGLSGWFITAAAVAGATSIIAVQAFNYMLPSAAIRLLAIARTGARYGERLASHEAAFGALARIRPALFRALAAQSAARALAFGTGEATARMVGDVAAIETRFVRLSAPWGIAAALLSGLGLIQLGGYGAAIATALCLTGMLLIGDRLTKNMAASGHAVRTASGALTEEFAMLGGASPELRCFGLEDWAAARIDERSIVLCAARRAQANAAGWIELLHATAIGLAATSALLLSAHSGASRAALAALAAAMTIDAAGPFLRALLDRSALNEAEARLETVFTDEMSSNDVQPVSTTPTITFARPGWARVEPGNRLAIIGASGSGKTTLVETLVGLRTALSGQIFLDGIDVADIALSTLRRCFAWAPQDAALLSGTVRDNLLLANPQADDALLWSALHTAVLDDRVLALDHGLDSWVGENGARLSGGERRRLSVARACCSPAPWLLLDEPSEGLDAATEALLAERLVTRLDTSGQGLLLVSHRPAMTAICAQRLVMVDIGTIHIAA